MDEKVYVRKYPLESPNIEIFLVDGPYIRKNIDVNFIYGGHDLRYSYIPKRQIWIDDSVERSELGFTVLHELYERVLMTLGYSYDEAHAEATEIEEQYRKNPKGLHEAIQLLLS